MASPNIIQTSPNLFSDTVSTPVPISYTMTGVQAGSTLVCLLMQGSGASSRTYSVSDNVNGAWTERARNTTATYQRAAIFVFENSAGGDITITLSINVAANVLGSLRFLEVQPSTFVVGAQNEQASGTTHYSAPLGEIDTVVGDLLILTAGASNATLGTITAGAGYTLIGSNSLAVSQYKQASSPVTDDRGEWTSGTSRQHAGAMIALTNAADTVKPEPLSMDVDVEGDNLNINWSEEATGNSGVTITASGGPVTPAYVGGSGTTSTQFGLSRYILPGETITASIMPDAFVDNSGNGNAAVVDMAVANNSDYTPDETPPTIVSAEANNHLTVNRVVVTFNEIVNCTVPPALNTSESTPIVLTLVGGSGTQILTFETDRAIDSVESLQLDTSVGDIADAAGNPAAGTILVTNNSTQGEGVAGSDLLLRTPLIFRGR